MVQEAHVQPVQPQRRKVRHAGFLLGAGFALLLDATLFRQLLAWHLLVEGAPEHPTEGLWQLAGLAALLGGVYLLWKARARLVEPAAGQVLAGSALLGMAGFHLAEAVVAHHLLGLHRVNPGAPNPLAWDAAYLAGALGLALLGWRLMALAARIRETGSRRRSARRASGRIP